MEKSQPGQKCLGSFDDNIVFGFNDVQLGRKQEFEGRRNALFHVSELNGIFKVTKL